MIDLRQGDALTVKPNRSIARYHGGKWILAPWIISNFPAHRVYVEPYCGAASVLLRKPRAYAEVINDLDGEMCNLFRVARDHGPELRQKLELTPFARTEFVESYEPSNDPIEQARRTVFRSFAGFGSAAANGKNTGFRNNSNRSGITPAHDWANYPHKGLTPIIQRLQGVVIECLPAIDIIKRFDSPETLFYVDPPYPHSTRAPGNPYCDKGQYRHEMTDADHEELAEVLHGMKGSVVLSGYHCDLYDRLYSDWRRVTKSAHADGARDRIECLWLKTETPSLFAGVEE